VVFKLDISEIIMIISPPPALRLSGYYTTTSLSKLGSILGSCLELGVTCQLPPAASPARKRQLAAGQVSLITVFQSQSEVSNSKGRAVVHSDELPPESQANYRPRAGARALVSRGRRL
jgi:hypothetical protein